MQFGFIGVGRMGGGFARNLIRSKKSMLELFASAMSHGGDFKRLIDSVDRLLYSLMRGE